MERRLYRAERNRAVAGVASGIADYFNTSTALIRFAFIVLTFAGGLGIAAYLLAWVIMPRNNDLVIRFDDLPVRPRISFFNGLARLALAIVSFVIVVSFVDETSTGMGEEFGALAFVIGLGIGLYFVPKSIGSRFGLNQEEGLYRSPFNRKIFGVFGGLAARLGVDATLLRIAAVVCVVLGAGLLIPVYLLYALLVPYAPNDAGEDATDINGGVAGDRAERIVIA